LFIAVTGNYSVLSYLYWWDTVRNP